MKNVVILLLGLLFSSTLLAEDFVLKSLWKANYEHSGKQYLAVVRDRDNEYSGDKVIIFGNKNGKLNFHYFSLLSLNFYHQQGSSFESYDDSMKLSGVVIKKNELLRVKVTSLNSNKSWRFIYKRHWSSSSSQFAYNALRVVSWRLQDTDDLYEPNSLTEFKRMLIRLKDSMGFIYEDGEDDLLPTFPLQIEQEWYISGPDSDFASDSIQMDGSDSISENFREARSWTNYTQIPDQGRGVYSSFSNRAYAFKKMPFIRGARKFVRYEITNVSFIRCGRSKQRVDHFTWILKDGSSFAYSPYLECD